MIIAFLLVLISLATLFLNFLYKYSLSKVRFRSFFFLSLSRYFISLTILKFIHGLDLDLLMCHFRRRNMLVY